MLVLIQKMIFSKHKNVATFFQNSQNTKAMLQALSKYIGK